MTEKIIRENAFEHKKKKPGLTASRPSNNWALGRVVHNWAKITQGKFEIWIQIYREIFPGLKAKFSLIYL